MKHINCLNPQLILNPVIKQSLYKFDCIVFDGLSHDITDSQRYDILYKEISIAKVFKLPFVHTFDRDSFWDKYKVNYSKLGSRLGDFEKVCDDMNKRLDNLLDNSYLYNRETSEMLPLYIYVPCGHCDYCNMKKLSSLAQRAEFAFQESMKPALFVTLTFNNEHLVALDDKKPFVKFKKRLLKALKSNYPDLMDSDLKFICTSEVGSKGRLHYHCIIFGFPVISPVESECQYYTRKLIQYCWREPQRVGRAYLSFRNYYLSYPQSTNIKMGYDSRSYGYVNVEFVDKARSTVKYILKYAFKHFDDSDKMFWRSVSVRLGCKWLQTFKPYLLQSNDGSFQYRDFMSGDVKTVHLSKYYLDKLFPSYSKLLPVEFRNAYFDCQSLCTSILNNKYLVPLDGKLEMTKPVYVARMAQHYLHTHFPFMEVVTDYVPKSCLSDIDVKEHINRIYWLLGLLSEFEIDYDTILERLEERSTYFSKLTDESKSDGELRTISKSFVRDVINMQNKSIF